jgi:hypothetical protein
MANVGSDGGSRAWIQASSRFLTLAGTLTCLLVQVAPATAGDTAAGVTGGAPPLCEFAVAATGDPENLVLEVRASCAPSVHELAFAADDRPFIRSPRGPGGQPAPATEQGWSTSGGGLHCTVDLAARVRDGRRDRDTALTADTIMAPLDAWLGMPVPASSDAILHVAVAAPPTLHVMHAMQSAVRAGESVYALTVDDLSFAGYSVFSSRPAQRQTLAGRSGQDATILVHTAASDFAVGEAALGEWVRYFAALSAAYWQGFPVDHLLLEILPNGAEDSVVFGRVRGGGGATLQVVVGRDASLETLYRRDWILTHELLHLAQPHLPRDGSWLMEGMATFIEPQLRHFAGLYSADQVWTEWLGGMPTGALGLNRDGLRRGNPYWSGAVALLSAAKAIVEQSGGNRSIADCLRGGLAMVGNATQRGRTDEVIQACDQSTGTLVLADFYRRHVGPAEFNLPQLWQHLGMSRCNGSIVYDGSTAMANLRRSILSPPRGFKAPSLAPNVARSLGISMR